MRLHRICKASHQATAWSGFGASEYGGRWNSVGTKVVYTAENLASAQLEMLVHLNRSLLALKYVYFVIEIPDSQLALLADDDYPPDWNTDPANRSTQLIGDNFVAANKGVGLLVRSTLTPNTLNAVLNPDHRGFIERLNSLDGPHPLWFDERLKQ